jgi:hypothetical protein
VTRQISYPAPSVLAVQSATTERHEDIERGTLWTDREVEWLVQNFSTKPAWYCAQILRRSAGAVNLKAYRLGLSAEPPAGFLEDSIAEFKQGVRELTARLKAGAQ